MKFYDYIIIAHLAGAIIWCFMRKKRKGSGCSCGCEGCNMCKKRDGGK